MLGTTSVKYCQNINYFFPLSIVIFRLLMNWWFSILPIPSDQFLWSWILYIYFLNVNRQKLQRVFLLLLLYIAKKKCHRVRGTHCTDRHRRISSLSSSNWLRALHINVRVRNWAQPCMLLIYVSITLFYFKIKYTFLSFVSEKKKCLVVPMALFQIKNIF